MNGFLKRNWDGLWVQIIGTIAAIILINLGLWLWGIARTTETWVLTLGGGVLIGALAAAIIMRLASAKRTSAPVQQTVPRVVEWDDASPPPIPVFDQPTGFRAMQAVTPAERQVLGEVFGGDEKASVRRTMAGGLIVWAGQVKYGLDTDPEPGQRVRSILRSLANKGILERTNGPRDGDEFYSTTEAGYELGRRVTDGSS